MKRLSLQWRITIMTALLTCAACVLTNCLVGYTGMRCGRCTPLRRKSRTYDPTTLPTQKSARTRPLNLGAAVRR